MPKHPKHTDQRNRFIGIALSNQTYASQDYRLIFWFVLAHSVLISTPNFLLLGRLAKMRHNSACGANYPYRH